MGAGLHPETPECAPFKARALVMIGPPGAGKGTQSRAIAAEFGIPEISTGFMLRDAIRRETPVGIRARAAMDAGNLVPDDVVFKLVEHRISDPDCARGLIVDGFPRNLNQAIFFQDILEKKGRAKVLPLNIRVDLDTLLKRLAGRRVCSLCGTTYNIFFSPPVTEGSCDKDGCSLIQRPDDKEEVIRRRLTEYERQTEPLIEYYRDRGLLRDVDGNGDSGAVTSAIFRILRVA